MLLTLICVWLVFSGLCTVFTGWDFGRPRYWAGPFLNGILGFGDGSAPPTATESFLLRFGITSACEDLYYQYHLRDGSKERRPVGFHVGDLAPMPTELLVQGFRGRRDDPFPQRFHTKEEKLARKKLGKSVNKLKGLGALTGEHEKKQEEAVKSKGGSDGARQDGQGQEGGEGNRCNRCNRSPREPKPRRLQRLLL